MLKTKHPPDAIDDEWLNQDQTAEYLKVRPSTLYHWRRKGLGPAYSKLGKKDCSAIRYRRADLDLWIRCHGTAKRGRPKKLRTPPSDFDKLLDRLAIAERAVGVLAHRYASHLVGRRDVPAEKLRAIMRKLGIRFLPEIDPDAAIKFAEEMHKAAMRELDKESRAQNRKVIKR